MNMWEALAIVLAVFMLGDYIGIKTKAKISSILVVMIIFLLLFMTKSVPEDICETAGLTYLSKITLQLMMFNMGTTVSLKSLKREWRTAATAAISMLIPAVGCLLLLPLIGKENVLVAIPVINGGIVSTNAMLEACTERGMDLAAALAIFLYALQKLVGTPPASIFGLKVAKRQIAEYRKNQTAAPEEQSENTRKTFAQKHDKFFTPHICIGIGVLCCLCAYAGGQLTHGIIGQALWCIFLGILLGNLGLVPVNMMQTKGNCNGILMFGAMVSMVPSLAKVDMAMLKELGLISLLVFGVTVAGTILLFCILPLWKIVGDKDFAIGISMCQMIGYPGTYLLGAEIAEAVGETREEKDYLMENIGTAYVIAGITTVTVLSVFMADIMILFL